MPIFSALGAECTVLDYSEKQLQSEKEVAKRESYEINLVKADMTKPLPFEDEAFDLIFHPVSNCYIEDVVHVWKECYRILKKGGILLAGLDNGINFIFDDEENELFWNLIPNKTKVITKQTQATSLFEETELDITTNLYLLPEMKKVDYLLKIEQVDDFFDAETLINELQTIKQITTAYKIEQNKLKSKNNLIF